MKSGGKKRSFTDGAAGVCGTIMVEQPAMSNPVADVDGVEASGEKKVLFSTNPSLEVQNGEKDLQGDLELRDSVETVAEKGEDKKGKEVSVNDDEDLPKLADGFFEIEDIRKKRVVKGQLQYLIKW